MSKQNSIGWLIEQIWKNEPLEHEQKVIDQAKAIHKQEMMKAFKDGFKDGFNYVDGEQWGYNSEEQYYNEIFKGDK